MCSPKTLYYFNIRRAYRAGEDDNGNIPELFIFLHPFQHLQTAPLWISPICQNCQWAARGQTNDGFICVTHKPQRIWNTRPRQRTLQQDDVVSIIFDDQNWRRRIHYLKIARCCAGGFSNQVSSSAAILDELIPRRAGNPRWNKSRHHLGMMVCLLLS